MYKSDCALSRLNQPNPAAWRSKMWRTELNLQLRGLFSDTEAFIIQSALEHNTERWAAHWALLYSCSEGTNTTNQPFSEGWHPDPVLCCRFGSTEKEKMLF